MKHAIKKDSKTVRAWQLGTGSEMEQQLINQGKIVFHPPAEYEVFSQEATTGIGEFAVAGDYIKIDSAGYPYPNRRVYFEENHTPLGEHEYRQKSKPLKVWFMGDPPNEILAFLQQNKGLIIDPENPDGCFSAPLFGTVLSARADAAVVIYKVVRHPAGAVADVDYNFVAKSEFDATYELLETDDTLE